MSVWEETTFTSPEPPHQNLHTSAESALKHYTSKLGITNNSKRITPVVNLQRRLTGIFSPRDTSIPLAEQPIIRSDVWSNDDSIATHKNRRSTCYNSRCVSCITSLQCRFFALGLTLGLLIASAALFPLLFIRQTSVSQTKSAASSSSSNTQTTSLLIAGSSIGTCNPYFCEGKVFFVTNMTTTALSVDITIKRTGNATYSGAFTNYSPTLAFNYTATSTEIVYHFFIQSGQLPVGNYTCTAQFNLSNMNHTSSLDKYSITTTNICGNIATASGTF